MPNMVVARHAAEAFMPARTVAPRPTPFQDFGSGTSVVISRPWTRDSSALEFILSGSRSRSRDLKTQVSVLVSTQHAWCLRL